MKTQPVTVAGPAIIFPTLYGGEVSAAHGFIRHPHKKIEHIGLLVRS